MEVDVFLRAKLSAGVGSEGGTTRELKVRDSSSDPDRRWWMIHVPARDGLTDEIEFMAR